MTQRLSDATGEQRCKKRGWGNNPQKIRINVQVGGEKLWQNRELYKKGSESGDKTEPLKCVGWSGICLNRLARHRSRGQSHRLEWPQRR